MTPAQEALSGTSRLDKLNVAAALHGFDKSLQRSAWGSLGWGAFSLVIGTFLLQGSRFGWINVGFGLLLIVEGIYELRVREPRVIKVAAATLGILGLWNLSVVILALIAGSKVAGGHPLVALLQLFGAWTTYQSHAVYAGLLAASDPGANEEFKLLLDQLKNADPATDPDVVEFTSSKFGDKDVRWRIRSMPGFMFLMGNEVLLGRKQQSQPHCSFVLPADLKVEITGGKLFGNKQKAIVTAADTQLKVTIAPEMAAKLMSMCQLPAAAL